MHELFELCTKSRLSVTDSAGYAEQYERESDTVVFVSALLVLLATLVWSLTVKILFE